MRKILLIMVSLIGIVVSVFIYKCATWEHYSKEELPDSARGIQEYRTDSFPSDFLDCMVVTLSREEYFKYVERMNIHWDTPLEHNKNIGFPSFTDSPTWWSVPSINSTTRSREENGAYEIMTYFEGKLYYMTYET